MHEMSSTATLRLRLSSSPGAVPGFLDSCRFIIMMNISLLRAGQAGTALVYRHQAPGRAVRAGAESLNRGRPGCHRW